MTESDEPPETINKAWPWAVYVTAYGLRIRHELTGTELDLYEAAQKLNDYDAERQDVLQRVAYMRDHPGWVPPIPADQR